MSGSHRYRVPHRVGVLALKNGVVVPVFDNPGNATDVRGDSIVRTSYLHNAALGPVQQRESTEQ